MNVFMINFNYYTPTNVVFGRDTEKQVGKLVASQNCKKVLIHYGCGSVIKSGLLKICIECHECSKRRHR